MTTAEPKIDAIAASRQLQKTLEERFAVFKDVAPLAIGIDKQVIAALPEVEKKVLRLTLRSHTLSTRYLKAMEKATQRQNLDQTPAGEVTAEQREHASGLLRERFKKKAEQKRAQEQAAKAAEAAARAEERKAEKLQQLADKFGRK